MCLHTTFKWVKGHHIDSSSSGCTKFTVASKRNRKICLILLILYTIILSTQRQHATQITTIIQRSHQSNIRTRFNLLRSTTLQKTTTVAFIKTLFKTWLNQLCRLVHIINRNLINQILKNILISSSTNVVRTRNIAFVMHGICLLMCSSVSTTRHLSPRREWLPTTPTPS